MFKRALITGAIFGGLSVGLGAFGAHGLKSILGEYQLSIFETGVRYQFYHSLALLLTGIMYGFAPIRLFKVTTTLFTSGIFCFSGSLYALALMTAKGIGLGPLVFLTPIGGLLFIIGWVCMLIGALSIKKQ